VLPAPPLFARALWSQVAGLVAAVAAAAVIAGQIPAGSAYLLKAVLVDVAVAVAVLLSIGRGHLFDRVGPANIVTTMRAALVAAAAGLIGEPPTPAVAHAAAVLAVAATFLDGLDGWLARRTEMTSAFGARFDMEVDAFLILILALLAWTLGKAGAWIILAGAMRYLFIAAGRIWQWFSAPLPPSMRRKAICVLQIVGLSAVVSPTLPAPASIIVAFLTLATLTWSFAVDALWLRRQRCA
jgi:phosphatidylglycerophosphate synthase